MRQFHFYKYQGTGNDFVLLDQRTGNAEAPSDEEVRSICDRHFGVGSDGLILLLPDEGSDMEMRFFNPDASKSFCGNGSRCAVKAFFELGNTSGDEGMIRFRAIDGIHQGRLLADGRVEVSIGDVSEVQVREDHYFVDTGSPHVILSREQIEELDLEKEALPFKERSDYRMEGTNVNLVELEGEGKVRMRTHERGVEAETLSCGSGVTAAALWAASMGKAEASCSVSTRGGDLEVRFRKKEGRFEDIRLIGPAERVFKGEML